MLSICDALFIGGNMIQGIGPGHSATQGLYNQSVRAPAPFTANNEAHIHGAAPCVPAAHLLAPVFPARLAVRSAGGMGARRRSVGAVCHIAAAAC